MVKTCCLLLLLSLVGCKSLIPHKYRYYLSDQPWDNIRLSRENETIEVSDCTVILRSNRVFRPERQKFLTDTLDSGIARTFLVTCKNGQFIVYPLKDVNSGMEIISKKQNVVVYVEGMGKNFFLAANRAFAVSYQYKVAVVMMDYPSINPAIGLFRNFRLARTNSFSSSPHLLTLLSELDSNKKSGRDWTKVNWTLFHHSMGNIMLKRLLKEKMDSLISPDLFDLVVLNAACTEDKKHKEWLERSSLGEKFIINYNKDDRQLRGAKLLMFKKQLGSKPRKPFALNVTYIDFNPLVGPRHSTFADLPLRPQIDPHARRYYNQIFRGIFPDFSNPELFIKSSKLKGHFIIR